MNIISPFNNNVPFNLLQITIMTIKPNFIHPRNFSFLNQTKLPKSDFRQPYGGGTRSIEARLSRKALGGCASDPLTRPSPIPPKHPTNTIPNPNTAHASVISTLYPTYNSINKGTNRRENKGEQIIVRRFVCFAS